jgi:rod shape-determining protein MreC
MPLGTIDRSPPPFFKQGASALSKWLVFSALALLLMVLDARLQLAPTVRATAANVLYPMQWVALQPLEAAGWVGNYFSSLRAAQAEAALARDELTRQAQRAGLVEHLQRENRELRALLAMNRSLPVEGQGADVLYDSPDPYSRKVVINRGITHGMQPGSAVMDGFGVLGQVTRVFALTSEVTLLTDQSLAVPVVNTRTGLRALAFGLPGRDGGSVEMRYVATTADIESGDLLTTSGVDGVYPPGLPVARVTEVVRNSESGFARVVGEPLARTNKVLQVLVIPLTVGSERP